MHVTLVGYAIATYIITTIILNQRVNSLQAKQTSFKEVGMWVFHLNKIAKLNTHNKISLKSKSLLHLERNAYTIYLLIVILFKWKDSIILNY